MKLLLLMLVALVPLIFCEEEPPVAQQFRGSYIIGGREAPVGRWPWQASLYKYSYHNCGASLISSRWLVSAAHCVGSPAKYYYIILGMHDMDRKYGDPEEYAVSRIIMHPGYKTSGGYPNDISLIQLDRDARTSSPYISTITMGTPEDSFVGRSDCFITGWGKTRAGYADTLQEAQVDIYTKEYCQQKWAKSMIHDCHVCVGTDEQGSCNGDSGGPVVCPKNGQWVLVGAASWGTMDCEPYRPSIYANVPYYREWIREKTGV